MKWIYVTSATGLKILINMDRAIFVEPAQLDRNLPDVKSNIQFVGVFVKVRETVKDIKQMMGIEVFDIKDAN